MKTKKTKPQIEKFVEGVEKLRDKMMCDTKGCLVFAYEEDEDGIQTNCFSAGGKLKNLAECIYSCMRRDLGLSHAIIAAANAVIQNQMMENQMNAETPADVNKDNQPKIVS